MFAECVGLIVIGLIIYYTTQQNQPHSMRYSDESQALMIEESPRIYNVEECSICLEQIKRGREDISFLKCGHVYHDKCLGNIIKYQHKRCSYCREDIELYNPEESKCDNNIETVTQD